MDLARRARLDDQACARPQTLAHEVLVHGRGREQGGDRQELGRQFPVGDDQDVVAQADRVFRLCAQGRERGLHAVRAPRGGIADVELPRPERPAGEELDVADLLHRLAREDGLLRLEAHRRICLVDAEQIGPRTDECHEAHHELLADRVDWRVGDLREQLLEVAVEDLWPVREHRERGVVAHRTHRFLAVRGHRREDHLQVFLGVAERLLPVEERDVRWGRRRRIGQAVEGDAGALDPLSIRLRGGERALQLVVVDDAPRHRIDEQHLAGLQAPLLDDFPLGNVEDAHFRSHHDMIVVGDDEARRPEPVAVERRAYLAAVGERHRRRTVPWLHQGRVVLVKRAAILVHQRIARPGFGDHQHHRVRERIAAHHEQLERVVERCGVGLAVVDQRPDLVEVVAQQRTRNALLSRADPVDVAAQRVDLAVVANEAKRMRQVPGRERVGRKPLVHHRERGDHALVLQVAVVVADLMREQHSLVDQRARRHRRHVELLAVAQPERLDRVARLLADDVELALERILVHPVRAARDEHLPDHRLDFLRSRREAAVVRRDIAPAEQDLPFARDRTLDFLLARHPRCRLFR